MKRMLVLLWVWFVGVGVVQASREGVFTGLVGERTVGMGGALERQAFWSGNGSVEVNSLSTGAFSGSIRWEGRSHGFAGQWDAGGNASVAVARAGRSTLAVTLKHREVGLGEVNGSVDNGKQVVDFVLRRADAWTGGGEHPLGGRRYTVLLGAPKELGVGYGVGSVSITSNGRWTLGGYLGNGQGLTAFGRVVDGGGESWILPVFVGGQSVVSGEVEVWKSERAEGSDAGGSLVWLKNVEGGVPAGKFLKELEVVGTLHWQEVAEMKTGLGGGAFALEFGAGSGGLSAAVKQNGTWPWEGNPVFGAGALGGTGVRYKSGLGRFEGRFERGTGSVPMTLEYRGVLLSRNVKLSDGRELRGGGYYAGGAGIGVLALTSEAAAVERVEQGMVGVLGGTLPSGSVLAGQSVGDFQIGKYEVTWGEWKTVREWAVAHGYDLAGVGAGTGDSYPVINVTWYAAVKWCNARSEKEGKTPVYLVNGAAYRSGQSTPSVKAYARGYRLPSVAEWEWAARGGRQTHGYAYSGSDSFVAVAWTLENSAWPLEPWRWGTKVVGTKVANELGIFDMSGNVREWCWDLRGSERWVRGGGSDTPSGLSIVTYPGSGVNPALSNDCLGFRMALSTGQWLSADASLKGLVLSSGVMGPAFAAGTTTYAAIVRSGVSGLTVTPTVSQSSATVQVRINGGTYAPVSDGKASGTLPLKTGSNALEVKVTAEDGATVKTYTVAVSVDSGTAPATVSVLGGTLTSASALAGQSVGDFQIGKTEVTWGQWRRVREWAVANGYGDLAGVGTVDCFWLGANLYASGPGNLENGDVDSYPVERVSWYDAMKWCNALSEKEGRKPVYELNGAPYRSGQSEPRVNGSANGYRLPTEAEWEWAASGGRQTHGYKYSGSNDVNAVAWSANNSGGYNRPVATRAANELGINDMSGNVDEWCWDLFSNKTADSRVTRGDDCHGGVNEVSYRSYHDVGPTARWQSLGFRLAYSFGQSLSSNASLSGLALGSGVLSPAFATDKTVYTASIVNGADGIAVTPTVSQSGARVEVRTNGGVYALVPRSHTSAPLGLRSGSNTLEVRVTAEDGVTVKTYTVNVAVTLVSSPTMVSVLGGKMPNGSRLVGQTVGDFQMGKFEVTWGEWKTVRDWAEKNGYTGLDSSAIGPSGKGENHPVQDADWSQVLKWCNAKSEKEGRTPVYEMYGAPFKSGYGVPTVKASANGYRLPTELEWEWAARGGRQTHGYTYSGGNDLDVVAWYGANSNREVKVVGNKAPNELGLYDMSGNVCELTYEGQLLGGQCNGMPAQCAVADRNTYDPGRTYMIRGFRVASNSGQ